MRGIRVLVGFVLASLAAALTLILFVYTPAELVTLPADMRADRMAEAGLFALAVAPQVAAFSALFVLIAAAFAEVRLIASWTYYVLVGIGIAVAGFLAQHFSEGPNDVSILQNYALMAFLVSGAVGGLVYWYFSGRFAAPRVRPTPAPQPAASNS